MPLRLETVVRVRKSRAELLRILQGLPALIAGHGSAAGYERILQVRIGLTALGRIRTAFVAKAAGGTDEAGERWPPLKPKTIAYSRRHTYISASGKKRWVPRQPKRAPYRPSWMLTKPQREAWWRHYGRLLGRYRGDKSHAAAVAWIILKSQGAKTLLGTYGGVKVDILRDTGLLLTSLSPGAEAEQAEQEPPKVEKQVFRLGRGQVILGTNRKFAGTHHRGIPGRLPQRRLWPDPRKWPRTWWTDIAEQAREGAIDIVLYLVRK